MQDWKIGTRITAGFASVILIALALGFFAYNATVNIEHSGDALAKDFLPSVSVLSHVQADQYKKTNLLIAHARSSDQKEMDLLEEKIKNLTDDVTASLASYEATESTNEEKALYAKVKTNRVAFAAEFEEVRRLSREGTEASNRKAIEEISQGLMPLLDLYAGSIQTLVDYDMKGSNEGLQAINASVSNAKRGIIVGLLLALALATCVASYIVRSITRPIASTVDVLQKVAECDMTVTLDIHTRDEMGQMAVALNDAVARLRTTLREVATSARGASASSQELSAAAESIASGAQEQAASLEETSASLEEITATVRQSADNARQANQLANSSKDAAETGRQVVSNAVSAMGEINVASARISDIISTIDEIAFQTNLLAVNAAVEAARAGDEGRGFAVVASEVRSLAQRSAGAAKEIKGLIQDTLKKVERGSELVKRSGETLLDIIGSVKRVTDIVGEISAAADEQSAGIEQVNTAVTQIDQVTQSNSSQTEELAATANSLSDQSRRLTTLVSVFKLDESTMHTEEVAPVRPTVPSRPVLSKMQSVASRIKAKANVREPLMTPSILAGAHHGGDSGFEGF